MKYNSKNFSCLWKASDFNDHVLRDTWIHQYFTWNFTIVYFILLLLPTESSLEPKGIIFVDP